MNYSILRLLHEYLKILLCTIWEYQTPAGTNTSNPSETGLRQGFEIGVWSLGNKMGWKIQYPSI